MAGGVISIGGITIFSPDPEATNIIKIIEEERGTPFTFNERYYVNYIVTNLKATDVWYKCNAIYGMVGGTAAAHKWNWKDMRDLDAAFRLTYSGTITHSILGMQNVGAASGVFVNTYVNSSILNPNNIHLSYYSSTNRTTIKDEREIGFEDANGFCILIVKRANNESFSALANNVSFPFAVGDAPSTIGYFIANRRSNVLNQFIKDGVILGATTSLNNQIYGSTNIQLLNCANYANSGASSLRCGLATIGAGLTDTETRQMSNIINFAQTLRANF